jgi:hypothetical protein
MEQAAHFPAAARAPGVVTSGGMVEAGWARSTADVAAARTPGLRSLIESSALLRQALMLATLAVLAAPAATPAAGLTRLSFPAGAALIAAWLALRGRLRAYITFCFWLFLLTPFVRRMADAHAGYLQSNMLMLAPYLALAWSALEAPRFILTRGGRAQWPMAIVFATILYGFVLGLVQGTGFPAVLDLLRWATPPLLVCCIVARAGADAAVWRALCRELGALALVALPLLSAYGLYQFVKAPVWDVLWMQNTHMGSLGLPYPFQIRVFGTMNSPASLAYYLEALILITLTLRSPIRWLNVALGSTALAVTLVRSAWLGLAAGLVLLLAVAPLRVRAALMVALGATVLMSPVMLSEPHIEKYVADRFATLADVSQDKSFSDRFAGYADAWRELSAQPLGEGLGIANVAANYSDRQRVIDGGPIEIFLSLGVPAGLLYLGATAILLITAVIRPVFVIDSEITSAFIAMAIVQALAFASVTTFVGEIGVVFWISLAVMLAAPKHSF